MGFRYPTADEVTAMERQVKEVARKEMAGWGGDSRDKGFAALEKLSFHRFRDPDPDDFDPVIDRYKAVAAELENGGKAGIRSAVALIEGWEGDAGKAAATRLKGIPAVIDEQRGLSLVLAELTNREKVLAGEAKHEIIKIGRQAINVIEDMENCKGGSDQTVTFNLNASVKAAGLNTGIAVPGSKTVKPDFAGIGADKTVTIKGADMAACANSIMDAVSTLQDEMNAVRLKIVECLNANINATNNDESAFALKSSGDFIPAGGQTDFGRQVANRDDTAKPPPPDRYDREKNKYPWEPDEKPRRTGSPRTGNPV